jgi:defect-in-organelle-trafficking protein DotC
MKALRLITLLAAATSVCATATAQSAANLQPIEASVEQIIKAVKTGPDNQGLALVRETVLRESAAMLGARQGLRDKSCAIRTELTLQGSILDRKFRFNELMMGRGIFPPVISEARDSVSLEQTVMRVATRVYRIDEGARVVDLPPTWRDWLYVGLAAEPCEGPLELPAGSEQLRPQNAQEEAFFRSLLQQGYRLGSQQAADVLQANLARLERAYSGMRRYYDLYARGMVSAPVIVSSTDVVKRDDPNTLVVGNTVIRITVPVDFVENAQRWKPLAE